jgi:AcrR family transcriptional regulator
VTPTTRTRKAGARDRLIAAAERVFLTEGIRAVGVDRLCAEAEVSKRSLYQHFSGKDEVVTAMLQAQAEKFGATLAGNDEPPRERILATFAPFASDAPATELTGCPFVGAATELKDPDHPASRLAREQKVALTSYFAQLARAGGARDPDLLALQLTLVFDGASAFAVVRGESTSATRATVETLLAAHGM